LLIYPFYGVLILNGVIILTAFLLEQFLRVSIFKKHTIVYDNLDLLKPKNNRNFYRIFPTGQAKIFLKPGSGISILRKTMLRLRSISGSGINKKKKNQLPPEDN